MIAVIVLVVFEGLAALVQLIDPQGGLLRVNDRNPVRHIIIIAAALGLGDAAYRRACEKNKSGEQHKDSGMMNRERKKICSD